MELVQPIRSKDKIEELADMFIVACAIMRFNVARGAACLSQVCALREDFNFLIDEMPNRLNEISIIRLLDNSIKPLNL